MVNLSSFLSGAASGATVTILIKAVDDYSKEFAKGQKTLLGFSKVTALAMGTVATAMTAFGISSVKAALQMQPVEHGFKKLAQNSDDFLFQLRKATAGTISDFELMKNANTALLLGLKQNNLSDIFESAAIVGSAMGRDVSSSIESVTMALARQSPLWLDNLGIQLKLEDAHKNTAKSLGKTVEQLTEEEKRIGFVNQAVDKLNERKAQLGGKIIPNLNTEIQKLSAEWDNFKVTTGKAVIPSLTSILSGINGVIKAGKEYGVVLSSNTEGINKNSQAFENARETVSKWFNKLFSAKPVIEDITNSFWEQDTALLQLGDDYQKYVNRVIKEESRKGDAIINEYNRVQNLTGRGGGISVAKTSSEGGIPLTTEDWAKSIAIKSSAKSLQDVTRTLFKTLSPFTVSGAGSRQTIGVSQLGSKRKQVGGLIPNTGMYLMHQGEKVLPKSHTATYGAGTNVVVNINGHVFGDKRDFVRELSEEFAYELKTRVAV